MIEPHALTARAPSGRHLWLFLPALTLLVATGCDSGTCAVQPGTAGNGGGAGAGTAGGGPGGTAGAGGARGEGDVAGQYGAGGGSAANGGAGGETGGGAGGPGGGTVGPGLGGATGAGGAPACVAPPVPTDSTMAGCPVVPYAPLGEASHPEEGYNHVVVCSSVCYGTNPPSSGNHYPVWPVYKTYDAPVPWGFLVHGLEHGSIIVSYNCPCGCADEVAAAQVWIDALPEDTDCGTRPRVVMAPDPSLDVRWAASAWTWTLRAQSFDPAAFQAFFLAHYNHGREEICDGYTDGSATGWCQ